jgi:hypothetical protein
MAADPTREGDGHIGEGWLDVPDPLGGAAAPRPSRATPAPAAPSLTRDEARARRRVALVGSIAWSGTMLAFFGLRRELGAHSNFVAGQTMLWMAMLSSALVIAVTAGRRGLGSPVAWLRTLAVAAPFLFLVVGLSWLPADAGTEFGATGPASAIVRCLLLGLGVVVPTLALGVWSVRRAFPSAAAWRGAVLGVASGLAAAVVLTLHCSSPFGGHVALAHGLPVVLSTLAGAFFGSKLARS